MQLTRRQFVSTGAGIGAGISLGLPTFAFDENSGPAVITKRIPKSNEALPVIGLGTGRWVAAGDQSAIDELRGALTVFRDMGGRVIDTAPAYRSSEQALGKLIDQLGLRNAFFLATKVDRATAEEGRQRMEDSLEKLRTARVDLMQVHNMRGARKQLTTLLEWQQAERIRYIGITTSRVSEYAEMEQLIGELPLDFIQLNYSLRDRKAEKRLLPLAADKGIAVMANRPFGHSHMFEKTAGQQLPEWAADFDSASWAQFFLKYVVSHPAVTCTIPGTTRQVHVRDNMGANFGRLPDSATRRQQEQLFASL